MQSEIQASVESPIKEKETKFSKSGVKKRALELYEEGNNPTEVYRIMKNEGFDVSDEGIRQLLIRDGNITRKAISDVQASKRFQQMVMDYDKELKGIMQEIKEARELAKETKDLAAWSALLGRAFQGIELFSKISGDLKENNIDINIILNEIDNRIRSSKGLFEEPIDVESIIIEEDQKIIKTRR